MHVIESTILLKMDYLTRLLNVMFTLYNWISFHETIQQEKV
jgi:hypothetical protein